MQCCSAPALVGGCARVCVCARACARACPCLRVGTSLSDDLRMHVFKCTGICVAADGSHIAAHLCMHGCPYAPGRALLPQPQHLCVIQRFHSTLTRFQVRNCRDEGAERDGRKTTCEWLKSVKTSCISAVPRKTRNPMASALGRSQALPRTRLARPPSTLPLLALAVRNPHPNV